MNPNNNSLLSAYLKARKKIIDEALERYLSGEDNYPPVIFKAVRYSVFAGGKRIRPILCMASAEAVGGNVESILPVACSLELIHTYSLIHDDLPAIDDDDYRRGRLTSHKVFGEDIAILAGDALLTEAFRLMSERTLMDKIPPEKLLAVIHDVAEAAGYFGMVGGQVVDVQSEGKDVDSEVLNYIHTRKTGAMITVAVKAGALLSNAGEVEINALISYGRHVGLAFQIADDILNVEGDKVLLGKGTGSDAKRGKVTYPALMGLDASRKKAADLVESALSAIKNFDHRAEPLRMIAGYIVERRA
ncbi:MAG: polyprenyl synthetase family protein [Deltaproteobacteria bacterium]|nr:polyprenyl synthetase family protein [Deltaproteobacteria bacterium]